MGLKIKDKKCILTKLYFKQLNITRKFELKGSFVYKGSGSGYGIFPDPDPGNPKRPDPTGSGSATLLKTPPLDMSKSANFFFERLQKAEGGGSLKSLWKCFFHTFPFSYKFFAI